MNDETRERLIKIEADRLDIMDVVTTEAFQRSMAAGDYQLAMRALDTRTNIEASRRRLLGADK